MGAVADVGRVRVRGSVAGSRGGGVFVPMLQRARLLDATVGLVVEVGVRVLGGLMAMIVLPYRGRDIAAGQLQLGQADSRFRSAEKPRVSGLVGRASGVFGFRPTLRTFTVLSAIAEWPGLNNRGVSERAGVSDQGQMSRLLWRLEDQGLVENTGGYAQGTPKAWSLTVLGEQALQQASSPHDAHLESV
jgi:hypothetical protein